MSGKLLFYASKKDGALNMIFFGRLCNFMATQTKSLSLTPSHR